MYEVFDAQCALLIPPSAPSGASKNDRGCPSQSLEVVQGSIPADQNYSKQRIEGHANTTRTEWSSATTVIKSSPDKSFSKSRKRYRSSREGEGLFPFLHSVQHV